MLRVRADWSVADREMDKVFSSPCVQQILAGVVLLEVGVTENTSEGREPLKQYEVFGPPSIVLFGEDGRHFPEISGYQTEAQLAERLRMAFGTRQGTSNCGAD